MGLDGASGLTVSRDGKNVYVASGSSDAVAVFARDRRTGALTQLSGTEACISEDGTGGFGEDGECTDGVGLITPVAVTTSNDGKNVYAASFTNDAVAVLARQLRSGANLSSLDALPAQ
jgi:DNA-binding beta-propeller fold protein YncE